MPPTSVEDKRALMLYEKGNVSVAAYEVTYMLPSSLAGHRS